MPMATSASRVPMVADRSQGVVLVEGGDAEHGHDRVTDEFGHHSTVGLDHRPHGPEVVGHEQ